MNIHSKNAKVGMIICRNHYPYKPIKVMAVADYGIRVHPMKHTGTKMSQEEDWGRTFTMEEFDKAEYMEY